MKNAVKACDLASEIAVRAFESLNPGRVTFYARPGSITVIFKGDPDTLTYLEGWYYNADKGVLTNTPQDGTKYEVPMVPAGESVRPAQDALH